MLAVMAAGLVLGGIALKRRRDRLLARAEACREQAELWAYARESWPWMIYYLDQASNGPESAWAFGTARLEYWTRMERKYRRAARNPWLPVAPDPPDGFPPAHVAMPADEAVESSDGTGTPGPVPEAELPRLPEHRGSAFDP
jgi:hypothetical protein